MPPLLRGASLLLLLLLPGSPRAASTPTARADAGRVVTERVACTLGDALWPSGGAAPVARTPVT
ncbi:hypothetical protein EON68_02005, partial [archaeon]